MLTFHDEASPTEVRLDVGESPVVGRSAGADGLNGNGAHANGNGAHPAAPAGDLKPLPIDADETKYIQQARAVSVVSIIFTGILGVISVYRGLADNVVALLGLGFEFLMDVMSSVLVIWRFKTAKPRDQRTKDDGLELKMKRDRRREANAVRLIGLLFLILAGFLMAKGLSKFAEELKGRGPVTQEELDAEASDDMMMQPVAAIGCTVLAVWKSWVAKHLQSPIMRKDAFCTWLGAGLSVVAVLAGVFEELGLGLADPIAAVLVGIVLTREGYHSLIESNEAFEVLAEEKVALSCEEAAKMMQARHNSELDRAVSTATAKADSRLAAAEAAKREEAERTKAAKDELERELDAVKAALNAARQQLDPPDRAQLG
jgi:divalent metal cation (Fe/Co/Zn/Cd) transporter